jgi:hypothetical protein
MKSRCTAPIPSQTVYFGNFMSAVCLHIYEARILQSKSHFRANKLERRQWRIQVWLRPGRLTKISSHNRNYELENTTITFWISLYLAQVFKICRVLKIIRFHLRFLFFRPFDCAARGGRTIRPSLTQLRPRK